MSVPPMESTPESGDRRDGPLPAPSPRWVARRGSVGATLTLVVSLVLIAIGIRTTHDVRVADAEELAEVLGIEPFDTISDRQLLIDATFTGVVSRDGLLYSTYDRAAPPMKRACPT